MNAMLKRTVLGFVLVFALTVVSPICAFASMKGDVNENGEVNIVDVQIAYDISCGVYDDMPNLSAMLVAADVNGDGTVDPADAFAIQRYVMTGSFKRAPLTIDSYEVSGSVVTATFTYTNMRGEDSSAGNDYSFAAHQDGYALRDSGFGDDYFASVQPGYRSTFTLSWRMRTDGDVTVAATPYDWANGAPAERVLRVSGTSAEPPASSAPLTIDSYEVSGSVVTATFTYTNMRGEDSSAGNDYSFAAHQDGYALRDSGFGDDYFASVQPGYRSTFTLSWRMRTDGDVTVAATPRSWANGAPAERVLRVSGS